MVAWLVRGKRYIVGHSHRQLIHYSTLVACAAMALVECRCRGSLCGSGEVPLRAEFLVLLCV